MRESQENKCLHSKSSKTMDCSKLYSPCTKLAKQPVYLEVEQQTTISEQESEDMFTKPINIRLIDQFNEVFDETDAAGTNDDEHNEVVTNLRTIRRTRHREDMNQLRTLEDSRTVSILQKLCIYAPKIRTVYSTPRSILSEAHSESMIFTTPRSVTKYEKFATFTNEYADQHPTVMMNSDTSTVLSKADNSLLTPNSTRENGSNKSELIKICDMLQHDTRCPNHTCDQMVVTQHELLIKTEVMLVTKVGASMHILRIKIPVRHYSTDAIDDRVILLFDPGGSQRKKMAESIVCC
jgi:hypothetical protein